MADKQMEAISKKLHSQARELTRQYAKDFYTSLVLEAKIIAFRRKADLVQSSDVREALDNLTRERTQTRNKELGIVVGGAFFGAFVQGFLTELTAGQPLLLAVYTVLGFIGVFLVFFGLRQ